MTVAHNDLTIESDALVGAGDGTNPLAARGWQTIFVPIVDATSETVVGAEVTSSTNCLRSLPIQIWRRVLLNALMRSVLWRQRDRTVAPMSITMPLGLRHVASPMFTRSVRAAVAGSGVNPSLLVLSITDDTLVHADTSRLLSLVQLSDANIQLNIEGPNACAHLVRHGDVLSFDQIQIPMHDAAGDPSVHRMVAKAHGLDLEVTASNIANPRDLADARRFGARYAVGPRYTEDAHFANGFSDTTQIS